MKAVVAAFNQEKALVGAFSVITNRRMQRFGALVFIVLCLAREDILQWFIKMNIWSILTLGNGATLQHKYTLDPLRALVTTAATYSHLQFWKTVVFALERPWHR